MSGSLQMRDASGRCVSLLNNEEDALPRSLTRPSAMTFFSFDRQAPHAVSTPATPELLRSNSYDSYRGAEPISPITPIYEPGYQCAPASGLEMRLPYEEYATERPFSYEALERRPSYESDVYTIKSAPSPSIAPSVPQASEQHPKRHPCRFREEYGCDKTFTTSGHASRHAKIHTAEKSVPCGYSGCTKKFTRTDNMKQHLDTHYKGRARSAISRSLPTRERRVSAARQRSVSPQPVSPTAIEAEAYAGAQGLPHFPAPQVAATTVSPPAAPAMASPTTMGPSNSTRGLDALASVALQGQ